MSQVSSTIWRTLSQKSIKVETLPTGIDSLWDKAAGYGKKFTHNTKKYMNLAAKVLELEHLYMELPDRKLKILADDFRNIFRRGRETQEDTIRAFAFIREVAVRTLGMKPYQVQVAGGMVMNAGCVAEMSTGEGKTLTATMPATIAGWKGKGCHVITFNDYLATRDADLMRKVYEFCGLSVVGIDSEMQPCDRAKAYQADITYCTSKDVAADFLRDKLSLGKIQNLPQALLANIGGGSNASPANLTMRGLAYAIIDEADSSLIDEAVTPLIISGEAPDPMRAETFSEAAFLIKNLAKGEHFKLDERFQEITLTPEGQLLLEQNSSAAGSFWKGQRRREELCIQALVARELYREGKQYVIDEGKVVIVDEFTGRLMPDREWRDGLHQAVTAKEELEIQPPKDTYARISFQRFFRMYQHVCGMTGTADEARSEFWQIFNMPVVKVPTNKPCIRKYWPTEIFSTEENKWQAIIDSTKKLHEKGRAVLIGTRSVRASQGLSKLLTEKKLEHQVLNAVYHKLEAEIVAQAGKPGKITVATNMAGRGTDIKLGRGVEEAGGLHVIVTERHESGRVDRQLHGRCARQGQPGTCQTFVSLEDELVKKYASKLSAIYRKRYKNSTSKINSKIARRIFNKAQRKAEKQSLQQRKGVLKTDDWLDEYLGFAGKE